MTVFYCVMLSCVGRDLAVGRSPVQGVQSKLFNVFRILEVNSEMEKVRGTKSPNVKQCAAHSNKIKIKLSVCLN
jgi:hypothetical protein